MRLFAMLLTFMVSAMVSTMTSATPAAAQEIGAGELWLHEDVMRYYRKFESNPGRSYFAVSTNGFDAGFSYCPSPNDCLPLTGKIEAIRACNRARTDLPGTCYIFANESRVLWRGTVHVLDHEAFLAHHYGPATIDQALAKYVAYASGPQTATAEPFKPAAAVWNQSGFRFPPGGFALSGDECLYAFETLYLESAVPNFFLADEGGRHCSYVTGYAAAHAGAAFQEAAAACRQLADGRECYVYAVDRMVLPGRTAL